MSPEKGPGGREPRLAAAERRQLVNALTIYTFNQKRLWIFDPNYERREPFMPLASMYYILEEEAIRPAEARHLKRLMAIERGSIANEAVETAGRLDRELIERVEIEAGNELEKIKGFENSDSVRGVRQQAYTDWSIFRTHLENPVLTEQLERELSGAHTGD